MRFIFVIGFVGLCAGLCAACSSSPSTAAAQRQFLVKACEKIEECEPAAFNEKFKSQADCVDQLRTGSAASSATVSPCSQKELDTCKKDTADAICKTDGSGNMGGVFDMPTSCNKC